MDRPEVESRSMGLNEIEPRLLIEIFNTTNGAYPEARLIHELFEDQVERTPDEVAVIYQARSLSYFELNKRANQLAHYLQRNGVAPDTLVAICVERSLEMLVGLLAILKAGGAYVPLDPEYPTDRLQLMVEDASPVVLLVQDHLKARFAKTTVAIVSLDADWPSIANSSDCNIESAQFGMRSSQMSYVIYTSGSTGKPKGVMIEHRNVLSLWQGLEVIYAKVGSCGRVAVNASFNFDASVKQLVQLLSGRTLVLVPSETRWDPSDVVNFIERHQVDSIDCTPAQLRLWISAGLLEARRHWPRLVLIGGEAIDPTLWAELSRVVGTEFYNVYGPTESTVDTTFARINTDTGAPHIGSPMPQRRVYILNEMGDPAPVGEVGEIYIGGAGVARGYWNRPDLTATYFIPDPFVEQPAARLYRSGDLGLWRANGTIEYVGRNDHQVKIRGFRIELEEIQAQLLRLPDVGQAIVVPREDVGGEKRLVAYVVAEDSRLKERWSAENTGSLSSELVSQWQVLHESTYELEKAAALAPSFVGWNSSYTGEAIPPPEMQEWLSRTVERITALKPRRALEIGCGVGLVLQQVAPSCEAYWGSDFSGIAVQRLGGWLSTQPTLTHVRLLHRTATRVDDLREEAFDTVILNSVVQYFPDMEYLLEVLTRSVDLLGAGGRIFIGDVRDLRLLTSFHTSVQLARATDDVTVGQLRARIARALKQDKELVIDPSFFVQLAQRLPMISEVEIELKRGNATNELTSYRYDVVLHIDGSNASEGPPRAVWNIELDPEEQLKTVLADQGRTGVFLEGIPNARLARDLELMQLITNSEDSVLVAELRSRLSFEDGILPERMCQWAEQRGFRASLAWRDQGHLGQFDLRLLKHDAKRHSNSLERSIRREPSIVESIRLAPVESYGNNPLLRRLREALPSRLRESLARVLPDYMVPSAFVTLESMPLTANGKLDRNRLPAPDIDAYANRPYEPPEGEIELTLAATWQRVLHLERVGRRDNFFELGGHSLLIVELLERLQRAGISTQVRKVFENPVLCDLAQALQKGTVEESEVPPNLIPEGCTAIAPGMITLVALEKEEIAHIVESVPGGAANIQDIYPLAPLQEGILFHHLLDERHGQIYVMPTLLTVSSRTRLDELIAALQSVIRRHDTLRTAVLWEKLRKPVQVVYRAAPLPIEEMSLDPDGDTLRQVRGWLAIEQQRLDPRCAPLMRLRVAADPHSERWYVLLQRHHIVSDHVTADLVIAETVAYLQGRAQELPSSVPYRDHVAQALAYTRTDEAERFFRRKLADIDEPTAPFGLMDVHGDGTQVEEAREVLDETIARSVRAQARMLGVSPATIFHAAWALVAARTSGRDDVVFGSILLGRMRGNAESQRTLGLFINTLPLRLPLRSITAKSLIERTQQELVELLGHEQASLATAQRCSGVPTKIPLFTSLLNYAHTNPDPQVQWFGAPGIEVLAAQERTNYPIVLTVDDLGEGFTLTAQTDRQIDPRRITAYTQTALRSLLRALQESPHTQALALTILPESERKLITEQFSSTRVPFPQDRLIHELFEEQVRRAPDHTAVVFEKQSLTYADLNAKSNQLARYLIRRGVGPDRLVGLCVERSVDMIVGMLAILKAGGAYVPLDPTFPSERLAYLFKDAAPCIVLTQAVLGNRLSSATMPLVAMDNDWLEIAKEAPGNIDSRTRGLSSDHLAYVIYTSGSTGQPKGAMIPHRNVLNLWQALEGFYGDLNHCRRVALNASVAFDASVQQFAQLLTGRSLYIVAPDARRDAAVILRFLEDHQIQGIDCTPSQLKSWVANGLLESHRRFPQTILVGGEAIDSDLWARLADSARIQFYNVYGPTECTVDSTAVHINGDTTPPHIGKPMPNRTVYILDPDRRPVPIGVAGELYIGGVGVARGYQNRPELTQERFVPDPYSGNHRDRLYRTGDLGRWRPDGTIEYLGRNDFQVKIRGYRMELGEIEAHLLGHTQIREAVVVAREEMSGERRLVAYLVPKNPTDAPSPERLREHLKAQLPEYMVPSAFVMLDALPQTAHGKLDRRALPAPELEAYAARRYEAPQGDVEEVLAGIWQDLLHVPSVGRQDNFFELGGHSLLIIQVMERLRRVGLWVEARRVFDSPTLADLAQTLTKEIEGDLAIPPNQIPAACDAITPEMLSLVTLSPQDIKQIEQTVPNGAANIQDIYPLAPLQEGILFHHLLDERRGDTYVVPTVLALSSRARLEDLIVAVQRVIDRHDILRTAVLWEQVSTPVQVVYRRATLSVDEVTLDPSRDASEQLNEWVLPDRQRLNLKVAPLLRLRVAADPKGAQWFALLQFHHINSDHVTMDVIIDEIVAHLQGSATELLDPIPFRNHVARVLAYAKTHDAEAFFRAKLAAIDGPTAPFGLLDVHGESSRVEQSKLTLEEPLAHRARTQARSLSVSAAALFHAAWGLVLAHTTDRDDIVFGTVLLGRLQSGAAGQQVLGMFINTLPVRLQLQALNAKELVEDTQRELVDLLAHEQAPLALAQRCSSVPSSQPLFSTLFNYRHSAPSNQSSGWARAAGVQVIACQERTNYPIAVSVDDLGAGFTLTVQTDPRINPSRIARYLEQALKSLLCALESAPKTAALSLSILPEDERQQVIETFNATQRWYPQEKLIHELFEEQVRRSPDAIAAVYEHQKLTYAQLNARANQLAWYLRAQGVRCGDYVPVVMARSLSMVIAELAVLKSEAAYVPLDPQQPPERQRFVIQDCSARHVLADGPGLGIADMKWMEWGKVQRELESLSKEDLPRGRPSVESEDGAAAYVMYTSGSTGAPKGVIVSHRGVNRLVINNAYARIEAADCVAHCSNPAFDASTFEIWSALLNGARLLIVGQAAVLDFDRFAKVMQDEGVTTLFLTTALFNQHAQRGSAFFRRLRYLFFGGEICDPNAVRTVLNGFAPQHLTHFYGPTEATTYATFYPVISMRDDVTSLPIGRPISNTTIFILDRHKQPVPIGVIGEIYIGGPGVAQGYLHRPELTSQRFIKDPYSTAQEAKLYKTGDLACWQPDGNIEFCGRNDTQVKIRGFRIELGEIEAQLTKYPQIAEAAVLARDDSPGDKRLVAYITKRGALAPVLDEVREELRRVLPDHMIPSAFVMLDSLPLTANGKVDRRALPAPELGDYVSREYEAPRGEVEETLAQIWRELLQLERIGRTDQFFELGGHSLVAMRLMVSVNQSLGCQLKVTDIYASPTIEALAKRVSEGEQADEFVDLAREAPDERVTVSVGARRSPHSGVLLTGGTGFVGRFLLAQLLQDTRGPIYCLVRAGSEAEASRRLKETVVKWNLWQPNFEHRVHAIPGDLRLPQLGLGEATYHMLSDRVGDIYHCATSMNHLETYQMAKQANVGSARALLQLATRGRLKLINYISTLGVFTSSTAAVSRIVDERTSIDGEKHRQSVGYSASKWVGEKIFTNAQVQGVPCNIFRLGLVWADTREGRFDDLQQASRILKSCLLSRCGIKEFRYPMAPTPVDYVARAVVFLGSRHPSGGGVFHISSRSQMEQGVFECSNEAASTTLALLPFYDWVRELKRLHSKGLTLPAVPLMEFAFSMDEETFYALESRSRSRRVHFDCGRTQRELEEANIFAPALDGELLRLSVEYMIANDEELREMYARFTPEVTLVSSGRRELHP